jgi:hypothetical protein
MVLLPPGADCNAAANTLAKLSLPGGAAGGKADMPGRTLDSAARGERAWLQ